MANNYPQGYLDLNSVSTKSLNVVCEIEGSPYLFSLVPTFKKIRYGDPGLYYGKPGVVYGGLNQLDNVKPILSIDSNLVISQKVEPEQGRASAATFSLSFIDLDGFMSNFISPGQQLDDVLGNKEVKLYLGYANSSFKEDYFVFFRGYITSTTVAPTKVTLQITDGNFKRKQQIFFFSKTALSSDIDDTVTTIPVNKTIGFCQRIMGPDGTYDTSVKTYIKIDDEFMEYGTSVLDPSFFTVTRGARNTAPAAHSISTEVDNFVQLQGNMIDLALKVQLSGWNDVWKSGIAISSFNQTNSVLGIVPSSLILPDNVDAIDDYGLSPGDYLYVTGSSVPANDQTLIVRSFFDVNGYPNKGIVVDKTTYFEIPSTAVFSIRSQYDTLPISMGSKLRPTDVDVNRFQSIRTIFFSQNDNRLRFLINQPQSGKEFIESEMLLPLGGYSVTRFGRISISATKPPIADERSTILDVNNIVDPHNIQVSRSLNSRRFFNDIQFSIDYDDAGNSRNVIAKIDTVSLNVIGIPSVLPIDSKGLKTDLGAASAIDRRGGYLLRRFKDAAYEINLKVNFAASSIIEVSDSIALYDNGTLFITNLENGTRDIGAQLFEVIQKSLDLKTGQSQLTLLSSLGFLLTDRFAGISPSTLVDTGSTTSVVKIMDSFGSPYPGNEQKKWTDFLGEQIVFHSYDYSYQETTTLVGFDPADKYSMFVSPSLSSPPPAGTIIDIPFYPVGTDPLEQQKYKLFFAHQSPSLVVVSGLSNTSFTLSPTDALRVQVGGSIQVHNTSYSLLSDEVIVLSVVGTTVTVDTDLGFVPAAGYLAEAIPYADGSGFYRIL